MSIHIPELSEFKINPAVVDLFRLKEIAKQPCSQAIVEGVFDSKINPVIRICQTSAQTTLLLTPMEEDAKATLIIASRIIQLPNLIKTRRTGLIVYQLPESRVFNIEEQGRTMLEYTRVLAEDSEGIEKKPIGLIRFFQREAVFPRPAPLVNTTNWIENCLTIIKENALKLDPGLTNHTLAREF